MYIFLLLVAPNLTLQEHTISHTLWHILHVEIKKKIIVISHLHGHQNFISRQDKICVRKRILQAHITQGQLTRAVNR